MNTKTDADKPIAVPEKTSHPMNIFLSYAHAHSTVVKDIIEGLRERGHRVWFDETNIGHGDDWREMITRGVQESNGVLSFLSRAAIREGGVCLDELGIAVGEKYGNIRTVLLEKEKELQPIPAHLTHRQWLDMSDWREKKAEDEEIYQTWLAEKLAVIIEMIESDESREFEGDIQFIREKLNIGDTAISRQGWYLRQPFVGRKWLTEKIENWMNDPKGGHLCAVYGGPGTGKSAFAAQYAYRSPRVAASLFFEHGNVHFNSPDAIVRELVFQLACCLPSYRSLLKYRLQSFSPDKPLNTQELFEELLAVPLQRSVDGGHETLCAVIDGLDECGEDGKRLAAQLLSEEKFPSWLRVVVLARPENTVTANLKPDMEIRLEEDPDANGADIREYFSLRLEKQLADALDRDSLLDRLSANADGVFLYAYIVADMILHRKLDLRKPDEYPKNLNDSFEKWFSRYFPDADEFDRLYKLPLGILAASAEPVPIEELDMLNARYDPYECAFVLTEPNKNMRRQPVVKRLERCAVLLKYDRDEFGKRTVAFTHRYIGEWMTKTDEVTGQSASRTYFCDPADACWVLSASWRGKLECGEELTDYEALNLFEMMQRAREPEDVIRTTASNDSWEKLLNERRKLFREEGKWRLCLPFAESLVQKCRYAYGGIHPDTFTSMSNLALTYLAMGRYTEALRLEEQTMEYSLGVLGVEHPATLTSMNNLALIYSAIGNNEKALYLEEQVLETRRRILPKDHLDLLSAINNLAGGYYALGRAEEALRMYEQVVEDSIRIQGVDHPDTLSFMSNKAMAYSALKRYWEALQLDKQVLEARRRVLPKDHPDILTSMNNLAGSYYALEKYKEALQLEEQVLETRERILGNDHPDTLAAMSNLASVYSKLGNMEDAQQLEKQALEARRRILGNAHPDTLSSMKGLSKTYYNLKQYEECISLCNEIIEVVERKYGADNKEMLSTLAYLAACYKEQGHYDKELPLREQIYTLQREMLGDDALDTMPALKSLFMAHYNLAQYDKCVPLYMKVIEMTSKTYGENSSEMATALNNLSMTYSKLGLYDEALPLMEQAYVLRMTLLGHEDPDTVLAYKRMEEFRKKAGGRKS